MSGGWRSAHWLPTRGEGTGDKGGRSRRDYRLTKYEAVWEPKPTNKYPTLSGVLKGVVMYTRGHNY